MAKFNQSNANIVNAIRNEASPLFQQSVPVAHDDGTNFAEIGAAITTYSHTMNEFLTALVNRIAITVIRSGKAYNPLAQFNKGMLPHGKDIEEVFVSIAEAQDFDQTLAETELYKRVMPNVKAVFHRINRYRNRLFLWDVGTPFLIADSVHTTLSSSFSILLS